MNDYDCARMLLESSFKEGTHYWNRNSIFMLVQTVLLGFVFHAITNENFDVKFNALIIIIEIAGIFIAILHINILKISKDYQEYWLEPFRTMVKKNKETNGNWKRIHRINEKLKKSRQSTHLALIVSIIFLFLWFFIIVFTISNIFCPA